MKKWLTFFLGSLLFLSLCCCTSSESADASYTTVVDGVSLTVDPKNNTISDGTNLYRYTISAESSGYQFNVTYPNGSSWWWNEQTSGGFSTGYGGWSDDYNELSYVAGSILRDVSLRSAPERQQSKNVLLIVLLLAIGVFNLFFPRTAWYLSYGWRYSNAEPSDAALAFNQIGGGTAVLIALILIIA